MEFITKFLCEIWAKKRWFDQNDGKKYLFFFMITAELHLAINLFCLIPSKLRSVQLSWIENEVNTESTNKCDPAGPDCKTSNVNQKISVAIDNFSHLLHPSTSTSTCSFVFCCFPIDFIIVWIMVIIANYNLLFRPLRLHCVRTVLRLTAEYALIMHQCNNNCLSNARVCNSIGHQ